MTWVVGLLVLVATMVCAQVTVPPWPAQGPTVVSGVGPSRVLTLSTTTTTLNTGVVHDNFERAGPTLGANWTAYLVGDFSTQGAPRIVNSSDVRGADDAGKAGVAYYNAAAYASNVVYACVQMSGDIASSSAVLPMIVIPGSSDFVGCMLDATATWTMFSADNAGTNTSVATGTASVAAGDYVGIQRTSATAFQCFRAGSATPTTWVAMGAVQTVANISSNGTGGLYLFDTAATGLQIEQWEMGPGALPTTGACGTN